MTARTIALPTRKSASSDIANMVTSFLMKTKEYRTFQPRTATTSELHGSRLRSQHDGYHGFAIKQAEAGHGPVPRNAK
jgi:hypothetical protein